jgi:hypothetical protein
MFPMLYILIAGCAGYVVSRYPKSIYAFGVLLVWQFVTTATVRPGLLAYANEAWGGPSRTHLYLSDSNVDWGQQLRAVKQYLETHPSQPCYFAYFAQGPVDFRDYGVNCRVLPTGSALWTGLDTMRFGHNPNLSGTVLLSDGVLAGADIPGKENPYAQFKSIRPSAVIDHGVYVYRGQFRLGRAAALEHVQAAKEFARQHNAGGAIREARIALDLDPSNPVALTVLGDALVATGDRVSAQSEYTAALHSEELDPAFQKGLIDQLVTKTKQ